MQLIYSDKMIQKTSTFFEVTKGLVFHLGPHVVSQRFYDLPDTGAW